MSLQLSPVIATGGEGLSIPVSPAQGGTGTTTVFTQGSVVFAGASGVYSQDNTKFFWDNTNFRLGVGSASPSAALTIAQTASTSGVPITALFSPAANTGITLSTNAPQVVLAASTQTFATGALAQYDYMQINAPTLAFAAASTVTAAATLTVSGPPIAGTNATISAYALYIATGRTFFGGQIIATGQNITCASVSSGGGLGINANGVGVNAIFFQVGAVTQLTIGSGAAGIFGIIFTPSASTSGVPIALTITPAANTGITASTEATQFLFNGSSQTWATGTLTTQRYFRFGSPAYSFAGVSTVTNAVNVDIETPVIGSNAFYTTTSALRVGSSVNIGFTTAAMTYAAINVPSNTIAVGGTTQVTSEDFSALRLGQITYTDSSAVTVNSAATLTIVGAPTAAALLTLTNTYAINVKAGTSYFQGRLEEKQGADVASATDLTLGADGNVFNITGTTTINDITTTGWANGSQIVLRFTGVVIVTNNGTPNANTAAVLLAGSLPLTSANNTILGLALISGTWQERFRKAA